MTRLIDRFGYVPPEDQRTLDRILHPDANPVDRLDEFIPRTDSDVPLLYRPGIPIEELWAMIPVPYYSKKICHPKVNIKKDLGAIPNERKYENGKPVWLAFDPERGREQPTDSFKGMIDVATASEVFTAMIMLKLHHWWPSGKMATQLLSRYRTFKDEDGWPMIPSVDWHMANLVLDLVHVDFEIEDTATASVRKY